mgnify:CR=1 FL=1
MKALLVIPAYNEAPVIGDTIRALAETFTERLTPHGIDWEIVVADNASTDGTGEVVRSSPSPQVRHIGLSEKGKGRAVRAGFRAADADLFGFTDADLSVPPEEIAEAFLLVHRGTARFVIGSRTHPESQLPGREWWRTGSSKVFNFLTRKLINIRHTDTQCPLKVMDRNGRDLFLHTEEDTWFFDAEFLALLDRMGHEVLEVPVAWDEHRYPLRRSKLSTTRDGLRSLVAFWRIRRRLPSQVAQLRETLHNGPIMQWIIVGLGNPGGAYAKTRHNVGRMVLEEFRIFAALPEWEYQKSSDALLSRGEVLGQQVVLVLPETFMNASGKSLTSLVKSPAQAAQTIVLHDDIDLPIGTWKISFDRGSGGHNGIKSLMETLKTNAFIRVRIGIAPRDASGVTQKPKGEEAVSSFVLGKFRPEEREQIESLIPAIEKGMLSILSEGREVAMQEWNNK